MRSKLVATKSPNQPMPPVAYSAGYISSLTNALRLYFNRIDAVVAALLGGVGGKYLEFPYGEFHLLSNQTAAAADTAYRVGFDTLDRGAGVYITPGNGLHVEQGGIYNVQFSIQFENLDSTIHDVVVWIRVNGADEVNTGSKFSVPEKHGSVNGYLIAVSNFYVSMEPNDYIEMWWATNSTQVQMHYDPAQTVPYERPAVPAAVATLTFVSNLPE